MVTHNYDLALQSDRIIYLKDGEIEKEESLTK
jgi:ABC-type lipoprotein export system ATPase subunit